MIKPTLNTNIYLHKAHAFRKNENNKNHIEKFQDSENKDTFEKKLLESNNNINKSIVFLGLVVALKVILDSILKLKNVKASASASPSLIIKNFKSLKNDSNVPTLENCKSINQDLKQILERQLAYTKAGKDVIDETGAPRSANRLLLCGSAGVGKSFFAKIYAKSLDAEYKEILYSDFNSRWCGEHLVNFTNIFKDILHEAENNPKKRYVVIFNELDTLLNPVQKLSNPENKATYGFFKTDERSIFLNYLEELKEKTPNVTIIGTTNILPQSKSLDQAALSRFQNIIEVPYPDKNCIFEALKMNLEYLKNKNKFLTENEDSLKELAQKMADRKCSFRNLEYIVNEAKNLHLQEKIKDSHCEFNIDFLKKGEQNLKFSDGELDPANIGGS